MSRANFQEMISKRAKMKNDWGEVLAMAFVVLIQLMVFVGSLYFMYLFGRALLKYIGS